MELCPGVRYIDIEVANVSKYQHGKRRTVPVCVFYRGALRAAGREVLGGEDAEGQSGLTSSSW